MQIAQDISSRVQCKKRRRSGLRRGFLRCAIGEIDKSRCVTYFSTVPKVFVISKEAERAGNHHRNKYEDLLTHEFHLSENLQMLLSHFLQFL